MNCNSSACETLGLDITAENPRASKVSHCLATAIAINGVPKVELELAKSSTLLLRHGHGQFHRGVRLIPKHDVGKNGRKPAKRLLDQLYKCSGVFVVEQEYNRDSTIARH